MTECSEQEKERRAEKSPHDEATAAAGCKVAQQQSSFVGFLLVLFLASGREAGSESALRVSLTTSAAPLSVFSKVHAWLK